MIWAISVPSFKILGPTVSESNNFNFEIFGSKMADLGLFGGKSSQS